ncbi:hypothetical protein HanXRQr2_Chr09g0399291 [Helianthus annuus]|uniref:Uncharacterized protein n=1 Tax=Helianthus annuus TaxID=4232 RepID=A0A9K3I7R5_HELAN|nr:hypothetical protein HanXRQr2_Chr09g0399291 [Helianthus annuus]KAJ0894079.1 hypothetical protein HanPSC8_Chr09g0385071 [Helianthus annuus]
MYIAAIIQPNHCPYTVLLPPPSCKTHVINQLKPNTMMQLAKVILVATSCQRKLASTPWSPMANLTMSLKTLRSQPRGMGLGWVAGLGIRTDDSSSEDESSLTTIEEAGPLLVVHR